MIESRFANVFSIHTLVWIWFSVQTVIASSLRTRKWVGSGLQFLNLSLNLYKFCCFTSDLITMGTVLHRWGYWCQRAVKRLGDPPPKGDPGSFSGQIQGWNTPREPPGGTLLLCVCTIGRSTGVSRTMESDHLSILSIYLKIFLCVSIV